ncbi:hypothetical protein GCM10027605_51570 [Micromonospora zhanjiangensis]
MSEPIPRAAGEGRRISGASAPNARACSGAASPGPAKASRPPGRRARPMFVNAATGSSKNITPPRLTATSKAAVGNAYTWASPSSKVALVMPSPVAVVRARAIIGAEMSTPRTWPAVRRAANRVK